MWAIPSKITGEEIDKKSKKRVGGKIQKGWGGLAKRMEVKLGRKVGGS